MQACPTARWTTGSHAYDDVPPRMWPVAKRSLLAHVQRRLLEQELLADVEGEIAPNGLARLCNGLKFEGDTLPPAKVSFQSEQRLRFALKGIAPWVVPWMCEQVGLRLTAMKRLRIGRVAVAGLAPGQWRYLYEGEKF
jgi:23S rRNA pseudouridine2604 synthase